MRWLLLLSLLLLLLSRGGCAPTGKAMAAGAGSDSESEESSEESEASASGASDPTWVADGPGPEGVASRKRSRSLKGDSRRASGRVVKQRTSVWESDDDSVVPAKGVGPSPKASRRPRYRFPEELRASETERLRFVKMTVPERLAPKIRTYTVAQEYSWACSFVGDNRRIQDGSVSGSWARLVEVMAGPRSEMMAEANREMREVDLRVRRCVAFERAERKQAQLHESFVRHQMQRLNITRETAELMWGPALAALREQHAQWIEEDLAELEEIILRAEAWRVELPDDEPGPDVAGLPPPDRDPGAGGGSGGLTGAAAAVGLAAAAVSRTRHK